MNKIKIQSIVEDVDGSFPERFESECHAESEIEVEYACAELFFRVLNAHLVRDKQSVVNKLIERIKNE